MKKFHYLYTCITLAVIAVACLVNLSDVSSKVHVFTGFDKLVHGLMYFVLSAFFIWEYRGKKCFLPGIKNKETIYDTTDNLFRLFWFVLILCLTFGGAIEFIQGTTAYRGKEMADLTADVIGGLFAYLFYYVIVMVRYNSSNNNSK